MLLNTKITVSDIKKKKGKEKITALTAYDYPTAKIVSESGVDIILVGDSLGMVLQGFKNTLKVTIDQMIYHTGMVKRAEPYSLVITDMPYGSYHSSVDKAVENATRLVKEGGAEAIKLEGGRNRIPVIESILNAEIPVMGHLGLTPQSINKTGGFKIHGKLKEKAKIIVEDAIMLEKAGVFAIVLESIPKELGKEITESVNIPTIGIGAGNSCDGQILVIHDLTGFTGLYLPKFVRKYADVNKIISGAISDYILDVKSGDFPGVKESYSLHKKKR